MKGVPLLFAVIVAFSAVAFAADPTCGITKSDSNFSPSNAAKTAYGEHPWLVALEYTMTGTEYSVGMKCSGALINKRFVLTAAQCVKKDNFELYRAWLGVRKLSDADTVDMNKVRKITIQKKIPHESYNYLKSEHDIALLKLSSDVVFSDYISPICLPAANSALPTSNTQLTHAGWGQLKSCGPTTDLKLQIKVSMYSHADCIDKWQITVRGDQICTGGQGSEGSCWKDPGAPIMELRPFGIDDQWFAIGIVSSNDLCNNNRVVAHTRTSSYADWIARTVAVS